MQTIAHCCTDRLFCAKTMPFVQFHKLHELSKSRMTVALFDWFCSSFLTSSESFYACCMFVCCVSERERTQETYCTNYGVLKRSQKNSSSCSQPQARDFCRLYNRSLGCLSILQQPKTVRTRHLGSVLSIPTKMMMR